MVDCLYDGIGMDLNDDFDDHLDDDLDLDVIATLLILHNRYKQNALC